MDVTLPKRVTQIGDFAFGVTEQQKVNAEGSTSDETENIAVSGFLLTGYEGAAAKYISSSRSNGIRINFKSLQIPWVKIVSISLGCTAGLVLIFLLVRIIKKSGYPLPIRKRWKLRNRNARFRFLSENLTQSRKNPKNRIMSAFWKICPILR